MDGDLDGMSRDRLLAEVQRLRAGIRQHRDSSGQELCWHHPQLWGLLPEPVVPEVAVPPWPQFLRGCLRYRESLERELPDAPVADGEYGGESAGAEGWLREATERIFGVIQAKDAARLDAELAQDFVHVTSGGAPQDRAAFLRAVADMPYRILEIWGEAITVRVLGDLAVVSGVQQVRVELSDGGTVRGAGAFVDLFARAGAAWKLRHTVSVELPERGKGAR